MDSWVECKVGWVWAKIKERLQQQERHLLQLLSVADAPSRFCPNNAQSIPHLYLLSCILNHHSLQNGHWTCWPIWWHDENIALHRSLLLRYTEPIWSKQYPNPSPTFINLLCCPENLSLWFKQCPAFHLHLHLVSTFIWYQQHQNQPTTLISTTTHQDHLSVIG